MLYKNWIDGFVDFAADLPTTPTYALWAAISAVSGCLQRRVWTEIVRQQQFANEYILLVGPPGSGKTVAIRNARNLIRQHEIIRLCPMRITKEALYQEIQDAGQSFIDVTTGQQTMEFHHSLVGMLDEFATFVRKGDLDFQTDLADLYDCPDPFQYKTKHKGVFFANKSWFTMIAGCTPRHIRELFTDEALEFGLPARIIMVYEKNPIRHDSLFGKREELEGNDLDKTGLRQELIRGVDDLLSHHGPFTWHEDAATFLEDWYADDLRPYPMDPKLQHYSARRLTHVTKLAIIRCAAWIGCQQRISLDDITWAKKTLLEVESGMHGAIQHLGENKYFPALAACKAMVLRMHKATGKAVPEYRLRQNLEREVPPYLVIQILDSLVAARHLSIVHGTEIPHRLFLPYGIKQEKITDEQ